MRESGVRLSVIKRQTGPHGAVPCVCARCVEMRVCEIRHWPLTIMRSHDNSD